VSEVCLHETYWLSALNGVLNNCKITFCGVKSGGIQPSLTREAHAAVVAVRQKVAAGQPRGGRHHLEHLLREDGHRRVEALAEEAALDVAVQVAF
jgi:hypothetical protein